MDRIARGGLNAQLELLGRFGGTIGGGTTEVHRKNLAQRVLALPAEPRSVERP